MKEYFKIKNLVRSQVPEFVKDQHPIFVDFMVSYYEWLSQNEGVFIKSLQENSPQKFIDVDETLDDFLESFVRTYLDEFPIGLVFDQKAGKKFDVRKAVKNIKKFYNAKGTEKAYRFLFRLLYDSEIDIYYPREDTLNLSGGKWIQRSFMRMEKIKNVNEYELVGNYIYQKEDITNPQSRFKARARVNRIKKITPYGLKIVELEIENLEGYFDVNEPVYCDIDGVQKRYGKIAPILRSVVIANPGQNYQKGDILNFELIDRENYYGIAPKAYVSRVLNFNDRRGIIKEILVEDPGFNSNLYKIDSITKFVESDVSFFGPGDPGGGEEGCVGCSGPENPPGGGETPENSGGGDSSTPSSPDGPFGFYGYLQHSSVYTERGFYLDGGEQLSSNKYIQDNDYYQSYSYVLKTELAFQKYRDIITKLIHPSGTKMFGEVYLKKCTNTDISRSLNIKKKNIKVISDYTGSTFGSFNTGVTSSVSDPYLVYIHPDQLVNFYGRSSAGSGQGSTGWQEWIYSATNLNDTDEQIRFFEKLVNSSSPRLAPLAYTNSSPYYKISIEAFLDDVTCEYDCRVGDGCSGSA